MDQSSAHQIDVRPGDHLCVVCDDAQTRLSAAVNYVADGLRKGEYVSYAAPASSTDSLKAALAELGVDVAHELARGALSFPAPEAVYLESGRFVPDIAYRRFETAIEAALAAGFSGCRFAGEPTWAIDDRDVQQTLIEFESRLNGLFGRHKAAGFCIYDRQHWRDGLVSDVLRVHPIVVVDDAVCHRNLYYEQSGTERDPGAQDETTQLEWMLRQVRDVGREEAKYRLALKAGRLGNWELDVRSDTSVRSLRHDQIFGYDEPLTDWGFEIFIEHVLPEDRAHVEQSFRAAIEHGSTWNFEARIRRHNDGAVRWIEAHGHPYPEGSRGERVQYLLGIVADITERRELERALREADRRKDVFLATLAHELRNPLAPIINALQLIQQIGGPDHEFAALHAIMERQSTQLVRLIDDLVDISRISRGQLRLQFEQITLQTVLSGALEAAQPLIDAQKHEISVSMPQAPIHLDGDAARLTQVFQNVLNNAAKYTPSGGRVRLEVRLARGRALISICDTGAGISAELLPKIFEMFVQGHEAGARAHGGLGIGLPLARQLLEMHGGSIEARSDGPGRGSEFLISLPTAPSPRTSDDAAIEVAPEPRARRILIVDDNVDAANTLAQSLKYLGHDVAVRYDGTSALSAVPGFTPDLVILDIGLPDLDGYAVAQRLRTRHADLTLVALTGWGQPSDRERARAAGFDLHRTKPVDPRDLLLAVDALH